MASKSNKQIINNNSKINNKTKKTAKSTKKTTEKKVQTTRVKLNKKTYNGELIKNIKKDKKRTVLVSILLISLAFNIYTIYHFIVFNHKKVKIETKTEYKVPENILFLGDSITKGYDLNKFYPNNNTVNSGIDGHNTKDILNDMEDRVYRYNPSKIFLLIGTNDIQQGKNENEIIENIEKIIEEIKDNIKESEIYLESIYPINNTDNDKINHDMVGERTNKEIKEINDKLKEYCKEHKITYIDLYDKLTNKDDELEIKYTSDGLHMSEEGYEVITKSLKEYL
ncbi:MAG: hypothetical protein IKO49_04090 [Bacilli bacterium]|nr:hypothetical protein [Bacilli bacterium]